MRAGAEREAQSPLAKCESDHASEKQDKTGHGDGQEAVRSNFFAHARPLASPHERLPRRHSPVGWSDNEAEQGLVRRGPRPEHAPAVFLESCKGYSGGEESTLTAQRSA